MKWFRSSIHASCSCRLFTWVRTKCPPTQIPGLQIIGEPCSDWGTFYRTSGKKRNSSKWRHRAYPGWLKLERGLSDVVLAEIHAPAPDQEWQLLSAFLGFIDRHFGKRILAITIHYRRRRGAALMVCAVAMATWSVANTMLGVVGLNARVVLNPLVVLDQLGGDTIGQVGRHTIEDSGFKVSDPYEHLEIRDR